jgi:hypothetical protein
MTLNTNITRNVTASDRTSVAKTALRACHALAQACVAAVLASVTAIAPTVTVSLLAASGFDPLGLVVTGLAQTPQPLNPVGGQPGGPPIAPNTTYKVDAIEFGLMPDQFVEYKFRLKTGEIMVFNWKASVPVDVDFHTVPDGKPISASETFMRGPASTGSGVYRAPYPGLHGWYWKNTSKESVTIVLNASGFFTEARMFSGDPVGEEMPVQDPPPPQ